MKFVLILVFCQTVFDESAPLLIQKLDLKIFLVCRSLGHRGSKLNDRQTFLHLAKKKGDSLICTSIYL